MKFFTNKSIWTKIVIALVIVLLMEFIVAKPSLGKVEDVIVSGGGKLLQPVMSLVVALADAAQSLVQSSIMGTSESLIEIETNDGSWWKWGKWVVAAAIAAVALVAVVIPGVNAAVAAVGFKAGLAAWVAFAWTALKTAGVVAVLSFGTAWLGDQIQAATTYVAPDYLPDKLYLPAYVLSPEEIFKGNILLFNVNFFGDDNKGEIQKATSIDDDGNEIIDYYYYIDEDENQVITSAQDTGKLLKGTVSKWYVSLRYIGIVIMMVVLLYIGIRMLISTVASDKAKYKQMLQDWFVGILILFSMHYIMVFANEIVDSLTKVVSTSVNSKEYIVYMKDKSDGKVIEYFKENGMEEMVNEEGEIAYPTNLMGAMRILLQINRAGGVKYIGYGICFTLLVVMEMFFIFSYLKRVLYMTFLTLMAPLVAVTYPLDKLNDGSAQGFNKWFKEYIFNLLIQPLHLLLYYILVTSAFDLASVNVIYSICAIAFMIPAEKLLRNLFGFEKSATAPSALTGAALTAGMMQVFKPKPPKGAGAKAIGGNSSNANDEGKIDTKPTPAIDATSTIGSMVLGNNESDHVDNDQNKLADGKGDNAESNYQQLDGETNNVENNQQELNGQADNIEYNQQLDSQEDGTENTQQLEDSNPMQETYVPKITKPKKMYLEKYKRYAAAKGARQLSQFKRSVGSLPGRAIRTSGKIAGGAIGATVGAISGLAQGDFGKTISSAAASAALGSSIGNGVISNTASKVDDFNAQFYGETPEQAYNREYNSKSYEDLDQYEEMKKNKEEMAKRLAANGITKRKNKEEYEKWMGTKEEPSGLFDEYYNRGLTDNKAMIAAQQTLEDSNVKEVTNINEAIALAKTSEKLAKDPNADGINREKHVKARRDELVRKGFSNTDASEASEKSVKMNIDFNKRLKNIY